MWFLLQSFCLKGEALDGKSSAVIDYTPYLKFTQRWVHWPHVNFETVHSLQTGAASSPLWDFLHKCTSAADHNDDAGHLKIFILLASVVAMITWVMTTIARVWTVAQVTTASLNTPTYPWSPMKRAGAQSVARWSSDSRLSMLRRCATIFSLLEHTLELITLRNSLTFSSQESEIWSHLTLSKKTAVCRHFVSVYAFPVWGDGFTVLWHVIKSKGLKIPDVKQC